MVRGLLTGLVLAAAVLLSVTILSHAGYLDGSRTITSDGTRFTAEWFQGCRSSSLGSLGVNQCHSTQPYYCPLDSQAGNEYVQKCGVREGGSDIPVCGCPMHWRCVYETGECDACSNPCTSSEAISQCGSSSACQPVGDYCDGEFVCTEQHIGYLYGAGTSAQYLSLYGAPVGDGTYTNCRIEEEFCADDETISLSSGIGRIDDLCPENGSLEIGVSDQVYEHSYCMEETDPGDDDDDPTCEDDVYCDGTALITCSASNEYPDCCTVNTCHEACGDDMTPC